MKLIIEWLFPLARLIVNRWINYKPERVIPLLVEFEKYSKHHFTDAEIELLRERWNSFNVSTTPP